MKKYRSIMSIIFSALSLVFVLTIISGCRGEEKTSNTNLEKANQQEVMELLGENELAIKDTESLEKEELHPMAIESLRSRAYPGGDFEIEKKLGNGSNYEQYITSYNSDGSKIYGLLTVPLAEMPEEGFPAILFIHGYIPPKQYSTTGNYPTYQARLARAGFVTFKPDLRGHGNSEGVATSSNLTEAYVVDTLFALEYLKNYESVNSERIGYWGHSNGGGIGLKLLLITPDIKAASLWAGMVGSYNDMLETYRREIPFMQRDFANLAIKAKGLPSENPDFWDTLDPYYFLDDIHVPVQLQHGTEDDGQVPVELSRHLKSELDKLNKTVEYFEYEGDNHNISGNVNTAFRRAIDFYNTNL